MSDTIFEDYTLGLVVNRNWQGKNGDYTQITLVGKARKDGYVNIPIRVLLQITKDLKKNVEVTKDAWWHKIDAT